jgi:hypothetical protein
VGFLIFNSKKDSTYTSSNAPVPPNVIQAILSAIQDLKPGKVAINTLFVNRQPDGSYISRFMLFDTTSYAASQYDVISKLDAEGNMNITDISDSAKVDLNVGYKPDDYTPYTTINDTLKNINRPETKTDNNNLTLGTRS